HLFTTHHHPHQPSKTVFVFPGQGAQYPTMATALYHHHRTFAHALQEIWQAFDAHLEVSLQQVMLADPHTAAGQLINQTAYAQPALFAFGAAMHTVFTQAGITPDYLLGHSLGEITAAYIAGVLSLEQAAVLVSARGRLMQSCAPGAMLAIQANHHDIAALLHQYPHTAIAAINSPTSLVVSGPTDQLQHIRHYCTRHHYTVTELTVSHAFHSPAMEPILAEFEAIAATLTFTPPQLPIISNLTGSLATAQQLTSAHYWTQQLRQPVRFAQCVTALAASGPHIFVELSPHPVLAPAINDTLHTTTSPGPGAGAGAGAGAPTAPNSDSTVITTLHRDKTPHDSLTTALAQL
ncbi:acyltransferase domain-containing protein, partial [Mycobacterium attenuatum]|uniref:acyltransferase domain-containing protein n=1 Tax=Mycobacterium attenuatum TaxID=2341086 RepID=UPI0010A96110